MEFTREIDLRVYGPALLEAITLDMLLQTMADGAARPQQAFYNSGGRILAAEIDRKISKLLADGYFKPSAENFIITANGMLHLAKGGYTRDVKQSKRVVIAFWLSVMAFIMALISFISTILNAFAILPKH